MNVNKEKIGPCEYALTIEIEPERVEKPLREAAQRLNRRHPIPGFRPGKAPYHLVERTYGKELIYDEMLNRVGNDWYQEALQESQLKPYALGQMEIVQLEPLTIKISVPVQPEVTLGDYLSIRVEQKAVEVLPSEVEEALAQIRESQAVWVPVEHAVEMGNQVLIDAVGKTADGRTVEQHDLTLEVSEEITPPGFGQNLVGIKPGESKEFDVEYPADFRDVDFAGKRVHFHVTIKAVKAKELPPLDDALAQSVGSYETLAELRARVEEELRKRKEEEAQDEALDKALDAMVQQATLEYPAVAVEREIDAMIESLTDNLSQQGFTLEGYLQISGKTLSQLRAETQPQAEKRLKRILVLNKFAEAEGITAESEEIEQEVSRVSDSFGERAEAVKAALSTEKSLRSIASDVRRRKALERLLAIVTGQDTQRPESVSSQGSTEPMVERSNETGIAEGGT
ncbi:MAG: trigger factor [Anaerolineae bacterium]